MSLVLGLPIPSNARLKMYYAAEKYPQIHVDAQNALRHLHGSWSEWCQYLFLHFVGLSQSYGWRYEVPEQYKRWQGLALSWSAIGRYAGIAVVWCPEGVHVLRRFGN